MKRFSFALFTGAVAAVLLTTSTAKADNVPWSYNWTPSVTSIASTTSPTSKAFFTNEPATSASGNSDIVAAQVTVQSDAPPGFPDEFTSTAPLTLSLKITDGNSGQFHTFVFSGHVNTVDPLDPSTVSSASANLKFTPTGVQTSSFTLGQNLYTVKYISYTPPGPPGASNKGSIAYNVKVRTLNIQKAPEPSTMLLAGLGASFMSFSAWRKRRREAKAQIV